MLKPIVSATLGFLLFTLGQAQAAELRWATQSYSHYSDHEPLRDVLKSVMAAQGIPVIVSEAVQDVISVGFENMAPEQVFNRLVSAYNLSWYYDGQALYVNRMDEVHTASLQLKSISVREFSESLTRLGILDPRFYWRASEPDGIVYFAGPERFVKLVLEMADALDVARPTPKGLVYVWQDAQGVRNFSSRAPAQPPGPVQVIRLQEGPITSGIDVQSSDPTASRSRPAVAQGSRDGRF